MTISRIRQGITMSIATRWRRVTRGSPCPICERADWCSVSADGTVAKCMRVEAGSYRSRQGKDGTPYYLHRLDGRTAPSTAPALPPPSTGPVPDRADADTLGNVYAALLAALPPSSAHREALHRRG